jgi:hypothetical protein
MNTLRWLQIYSRVNIVKLHNLSPDIYLHNKLPNMIQFQVSKRHTHKKKNCQPSAVIHNYTRIQYRGEYLGEQPINGELVVAVDMVLAHDPLVDPEHVPLAPVHRPQVRRLRQLPATRAREAQIKRNDREIPTGSESLGANQPRGSHGERT